MAPAPPRVRIAYEVPRSRPDWTLPEVPVPESHLHDQTVDLLKALLVAWVARTGASAMVARNLAVRWDRDRPKVGIDPDVCVITPRPRDPEAIRSLRTWEPDQPTPALAVEVVSASHPYKDYVITPEKYAACGVGELWVFDPLLEGPAHAGGPHRIQVWRREGDTFSRLYAGDGPAWSDAVQGWIFATAEGTRLRISDDEAGTRWWETGEESARAREAEARAREAEARARAEALERELEALRARKSGDP
jgi:Uma2 family endonuclease